MKPEEQIRLSLTARGRANEIDAALKAYEDGEYRDEALHMKNIKVAKKKTVDKGGLNERTTLRGGVQ